MTLGLDDAGADGLGDVQAEEQEGDEVEERRPEHRVAAGCSTRVETMVAIELAASCRPFRKSNSSATAISADEQGEADDDSVHARPQTCSITMPWISFGDVLEAVDDLLQVVRRSRIATKKSIGSVLAAAPRTAPSGRRRSMSSASPSTRTISSVRLFSRPDVLADRRSSGTASCIRPRGARRCMSAICASAARSVVTSKSSDGLGGLLHLVDGIVHRLDQAR